MNTRHTIIPYLAQKHLTVFTNTKHCVDTNCYHPCVMFTPPRRWYYSHTQAVECIDVVYDPVCGKHHLLGGGSVIQN